MLWLPAMRVLIADKFPEAGQATLRELGLEITFDPDLGADTLPGALRESEASILIVRSTKVTREAFESASNLQLVIRAGAGVNTIDRDAASERGVFVANCPGKNAIAVAELAMGLMLSLDRNIPDAVAEMRAGSWNKKKYGKARGLFGRTLGIVGFGAIGRELAQRARGFGMEVLAFDKFSEIVGAESVDTLDELLERSDAISLHVPYLEATHHLIGKEQIAKMKDGAYLIHTARGGVVDDAAVKEAVEAGKIRAALDVFENEPSSGKADFDLPLKGSAAYTTPHIGASTDQAAAAIADETVRIVREFVQRGNVPNTVNVVGDRPTRCTVVVRHQDKVGVLASVLSGLREEQLSVKEMQNIVFKGNAAACATITLERAPSAGLLETLRSREDIFAVEVRAV